MRFLDPGICKTTICYSGSSQGIRVYNTCLFSISPEPISNTRMFIYFMHCILIIMHLLQGSVMEQPFYKHRPRLSMTQSVIYQYYFYQGFGLKAFEGRHIIIIDTHVSFVKYKYNEYSLQQCFLLYSKYGNVKYIQMHRKYNSNYLLVLSICTYVVNNYHFYII